MKKYGLISTTSVYHEGDERSRTNPGHGYPAGYETVTTFTKFRDRDDMLRHYERWKKSSDVFIEYDELTFKTTVIIEEVK